MKSNFVFRQKQKYWFQYLCFCRNTKLLFIYIILEIFAARLTAIIQNQSQLMRIAAINRMHALVSLIQFCSNFLLELKPVFSGRVMALCFDVRSELH